MSRRAEPRSCQQCVRLFRPTVGQVARGVGRFCSVSCAARHTATVGQHNKGPNCYLFRHGLSRTTAKQTEYARAHRARYPLAQRARELVQNALRRGELTRQPCASCGAVDGVHAHHEDYARPLDVIWLCGRCHRRRHRERGLVASANPRYASIGVAPKCRRMKLSATTVAILKRRLLNGESPKALGRECGVTGSHLSNIKAGRHWAAVEAAS